MSMSIFFFFYREKTHKDRVSADYIFLLYVKIFVGEFVGIYKSISIILFLVFSNYFLFLGC